MSDNHALIDWLLEKDNPAVRCRTLTELFDKHEDVLEARGAKAAIPTSADVARIFEAMHPDVYWL